MKKVLRETLSWCYYIVTSILIVFILNTFIAQPTQVQGRSMEGTLNHNDRLIINKLPHTFSKEYEYGDIVVIDSRVTRDRTLVDELTFNFRNNLVTLFLTGKQDDFYWIKRLIGKEGDTLEFKDGKVIRNGTTLEEPYLDQVPQYHLEDETIVVPEGYVFVMGDNRNISMDSRHIGAVPVDHVIGKLWLKIN